MIQIADSQILSESDLVNRSIYDFVHEDEKMNVFNMLASCEVSSGEELPDFKKAENQLSFSCHLKRGTMIPNDNIVYDFVKITGNARQFCPEKNFDDDNFSSVPSPEANENVCFSCTVHLHAPQLIPEMTVADDIKCEFTSRHSMEWKFLFLDDRAPEIIGYLPFEVLGTSGYDYYHPDDLEGIFKCHEQLVQTGEGTSCFHRFLTKGQQWIWLKTRFYITYHQWNSKPEFVVCNHTVVNYEDVRRDLRKSLGFTMDKADASQSDKLRRSPSLCSVTSGGQVGSSWTASQRSVSPDKPSQKADDHDGIEAPQKPHSTGKDLNNALQTVSNKIYSILQQSFPRAPLSIDTVSTTSKSHPSHSADTQSMHSLSSIGQQMGGLECPIPPPENHNQHTPQQPTPSVPVPTMFMTPMQRQLQQQLQHKSQQLQQAILQQQEELRQITDQMTFTQPPHLLQRANQANNQMMSGVPDGFPSFSHSGPMHPSHLHQGPSHQHHLLPSQQPLIPLPFFNQQHQMIYEQNHSQATVLDD